MINGKRLSSTCVFVGGIVELLLALLHFVWPTQLVRTGEFAGLSSDYRSFLILNCLAVGLCLTAFGILSLRAARGLKTAERWAWFYGVSQGLLWLFRALLELFFPVRIPLFFISSPTVLVLPLASLLGFLFLLPLLVSGNDSIRT